MSTYPPGYAAPLVPIFVPEADAISSFNTGSLAISAGGEILMNWNEAEHAVQQFNKDELGTAFTAAGIRSIPIWDGSGVLIPSTNTLTLTNDLNKFDTLCVGSLQVKGIKDVGVPGEDIGAAIYSDENGAILMSNARVSTIAVDSSLVDATGSPGEIDQLLVSGGAANGPVWVTASYTAYGSGNTGASSNVEINTAVAAGIWWADSNVWTAVACPSAGGLQYALSVSTTGISTFVVAGSNDIPFSWIAHGTPAFPKFP
jgi:hypothetical protein